MSRAKYVSLHFLTVIILPFTFGFLLNSIAVQTTWYRLVLTKSTNDTINKTSWAFYPPKSFSFSKYFPAKDESNKSKPTDKSTKYNEDILLYSKWSLETVTVVIPEFGNYTKTFEIDDMAKDPLINSILKFSGLYDKVTDIENTNKLLAGLGLVAVCGIICSFANALLFLIIECFRSQCYGNILPEDISIPLNQQSNNVIIRRVYSPYRKPFIVNGILSLVATVVLLVGIGVLLVHSMKDSKEIIEGTKAYFGKKSADWLSSHLQIYADKGFVEYIGAVGLLTTVGLMNLCSSYTKTHYRDVHVYHHVRQTTNSNYRPPGLVV